MNTDIQSALNYFNSRIHNYQLYYNYYEGDHALAFATEKFRTTFGGLFSAFADNLCAIVVDSLVDRLELDAFGVGVSPVGFRGASGGAGENDAKTVQAEIERIQEENFFDELEAETHSEAAKCGDAYVIVWRNADDRPAFYVQSADQCTVFYDTENTHRINWAAKVWQQDDLLWRMTLYYPDRIEKYVTDKKFRGGLPDRALSFIPYADEPEIMNPYGRVPVFHFANNASLGKQGKSELKDVVPLQDALNKSVADMLVASEFQSFKQRYAIGLEVETDPVTKRPIAPIISAVDRWITADDPNVKFGEFGETNLLPFLEMQEKFRLEIARVSKTPLHYIVPSGGSSPSGEALREQLGPFLKKVTRRQVAFGNVWEQVFQFGLLIAKTQATLQSRWKDPAPRSEMERAQLLTQKKTFNVPDEQLWRESGYTEQQITDWKNSPLEQAKLAALQSAFASGAPPNPTRGRGTPTGG